MGNNSCQKASWSTCLLRKRYWDTKSCAKYFNGILINLSTAEAVLRQSYDRRVFLLKFDQLVYCGSGIETTASEAGVGVGSTCLLRKRYWDAIIPFGNCLTVGSTCLLRKRYWDIVSRISLKLGLSRSTCLLRKRYWDRNEAKRRRRSMSDQLVYCGSGIETASWSNTYARGWINLSTAEAVLRQLRSFRWWRLPDQLVYCGSGNER